MAIFGKVTSILSNIISHFKRIYVKFRGFLVVIFRVLFSSQGFTFLRFPNSHIGHSWLGVPRTSSRVVGRGVRLHAHLMGPSHRENGGKTPWDGGPEKKINPIYTLYSVGI